jgi:hypothetical protein
MKNTLILFLSLTYISSQAQTKLIAHKSHSGTNADFSTAFSNDLFDMDEDNLGMAPERFEIKKKHLHPQLDSVIFVSEQKVILVTSNVCTMEDVYSYKKQDTKNEVWSPGKEIAHNHPLFSKNHSLDSIKAVLKNSYGFENPIDNVVFVGYDNNNEIKPEPVTTIKADTQPQQKKERKKKRIDSEGTVLVALGLTLATFISGLLMLNRNN